MKHNIKLKFLWWILFSLFVSNTILCGLVYFDSRKYIQKEIKSQIDIEAETFKARIYVILKKTSSLSESIVDINYLVNKGVLESYAVVTADRYGNVTILEQNEKFCLDQFEIEKAFSKKNNVVKKNGQLKIFGRTETETLFINEDDNKSFQGIVFLRPYEILTFNENNCPTVMFKNIKINKEINVTVYVGIDKIFFNSIYEILFFNLCTLLWILFTIFFRYATVMKAKSTIDEHIVDTIEQIKKLTEIINDKTLKNTYIDENLLHSYSVNDICAINDNNKKQFYDIIEGLLALRCSIFENFNSYKNNQMENFKIELTNEKQNFRDAFSIAFKNYIPDIDKTIKIGNYKLDFASIITPLDIASGDGVFVANRKEKVFFAVFDVSGHGISSSFKAVILQSLFKNYFKLTIGDIELRDIAEYLLENSYQACKDTAEIIIGEFDAETELLKLIIFGSEFLLFFDNNKDMFYKEFEERMEKFQNFENDEELNAQIKKVKNIKLHEIKLNDLYRMIITTDGYYESFDKNNNEIGFKGLIKLFSEGVNINKSKNFINEFIKRFDGIATKIKSDDKTVFVVTSEPLGGDKNDTTR